MDAIWINPWYKPPMVDGGYDIADHRAIDGPFGTVAAAEQLIADAQTGGPASMLELYRAALRLRRAHPALGDGTLAWLDTPPGVLAFRRDSGFVCVVNLSATPYPLPVHSSVLLAGAPVEDGAPATDQAVWLDA